MSTKNKVKQYGNQLIVFTGNIFCPHYFKQRKYTTMTTKKAPRLTKAKRLAIYKKALKISQSDDSYYGLEPGSAGLCLLLPSIWNSVKSFLEDFYDSKGNFFEFTQTPFYFPEFNEYYANGNNWDYLDAAQAINPKIIKEWRIVTLQKIIKNMETSNKSSRLS